MLHCCENIVQMTCLLVNSDRVKYAILKLVAHFRPRTQKMIDLGQLVYLTG